MNWRNGFPVPSTENSFAPEIQWVYQDRRRIRFEKITTIFTFYFSQVHFVNQSRNDVAIFKIKIVMRTKYITRNNGSIFFIILLMVTSVGNVNHSLRITVAEVWLVRRSIMYLQNTVLMKGNKIFIFWSHFLRQKQRIITVGLRYHRFIDWIFRFIWKNTGWKTGNYFFHVHFKSCMKDIIID